MITLPPSFNGFRPVPSRFDRNNQAFPSPQKADTFVRFGSDSVPDTVPPTAFFRLPERVAGVGVGVLQGRRDYQEDVSEVAFLPTRPASAYPGLLQTAYHTVALTTQIDDHAAVGSTSVTAIVTPDNQLHGAWLGDSSIFLMLRDKETGEVHLDKLTQPHTPANKKEQERIERAGGQVVDVQGHKRLGSVWGTGINLAMSRAFGDTGFPGLSQDPSLLNLDLNQWDAQKYDRAILVASDGLDENPSSRDYLKNAIKENYQRGDLDNMAYDLVNAAYASGSNDNITCLFMALPDDAKRTQDVLLQVADGHGGDTVSKIVAPAIRRILQA